MTPHLHSMFLPGCYRCELARDEEAAASRDDRVEDVARTIYALEAIDKKGKYRWRDEPVGYIKVTRERARDLIDAFDAEDEEL